MFIRWKKNHLDHIILIAECAIWNDGSNLANRDVSVSMWNLFLFIYTTLYKMIVAFLEHRVWASVKIQKGDKFVCICYVCDAVWVSIYDIGVWIYLRDCSFYLVLLSVCPIFTLVWAGAFCTICFRAIYCSKFIHFCLFY